MWEKNGQGEPRRLIRRVLGRSVCESTVVDETNQPETIVPDVDGAAVAVTAVADVLDLTQRLERRSERDTVARYLTGHSAYIDDDFLPPVA
jgi:hypothetical protein